MQIDMSINTTYVKAIQSAQHFIYIENQYFLGSSYNWTQYKDLGANNLIPMEIALKIANKIIANERFAVYVVVPMWPEGVPTSITTQRILFWQNKTMQMMYGTIYKALEEVGLENTYVPKDYLNFFCLENRKAPDEHTGFLEDIFTVPKSLEYVRRVRSLGESNWRQFAAEDVSEMRGHLLKYLVEVDPRGKVKPVPGCKSFPDVGGTIVGQSGGPDTDRNQLLRLVYVSREKRPEDNHHKKASTMNALVRVSAVLTNAPYLLNLDCNHYINNSKALREGMRFMMDPLLGKKYAMCSFHRDVTVVDIGKSTAAYFEHEISITREAKSPFKKRLSCWKKLCDCELWLTEKFPVNDFDSLGYGEFL
ncbi:hypothetical protein GIB67_018723 [Kingdonia uniflora]|uniref:Uncharacterized protein n=1 Tax=Kingdonia uniflora TaxID=39325 RepID=A0A7J7L253_9MAGN|nr:hypothetical protein GIB67_018723 [Kingdonia uniflora]